MTSKVKCPKCNNEFPLESNITNEEDIVNDFLIGDKDKLKLKIEALQAVINEHNEEPMVVGKITKVYAKLNKAIVIIEKGNRFYVNTLKGLKLKTGDEVLCQSRNLKVISVLI